MTRPQSSSLLQTKDAEKHPPSDNASQTTTSESSRRSFLKTGTVASAALATGMGSTRAVRGAEPADVSKDYVRIGLVGAGGRGGGAINDTLTINEKIRVVAIADLDEDK
ncbi:MAG: twin-arginine translocation signal domain-containing protein, partial [Rubripirellula sp.]